MLKKTLIMSSNVYRYPLPTTIKVPKPGALELLAFIIATQVTGASKF
jgi:hypothetical protein